MKLNICEYELMHNLQQKGNRKSYKIGFTRAIMDVGNFRKFQEDSILITSHKESLGNEMLLVADGMGGLENGARASRLSAMYLMAWFQTLDSSVFKATKYLKSEFSTFICKLDEIIRQECGKGGTTLVCAFILKDSLVVANIGDSRAYIYNDDNLIQLTVDHSITQNLFNEGVIEEKDNMRFHKNNHLILSRIGCEKKLLELDFYEMGIDKFDKLFLFSDGITDCISEKRLKELIKINSDNILCDAIINEALNIDSYLYNLNHDDYYDKISAGKDNASIVFRRNRKLKK